MAHTHKHLNETLYTNYLDIEVYSSGGVLHTVAVTRYIGDDGTTEEWRRSFNGSTKAYEYIKQLTAGLISESD